jgi:hypothetical protein
MAATEKAKGGDAGSISVWFSIMQLEKQKPVS